MTQNDEVLALLRGAGEHGITSLEALYAVGSFRLAARIADLKAEGHVITSTLEPTPSGKHVARYRLVEEPVQMTLL
jgi:hypothetical protein